MWLSAALADPCGGRRGCGAAPTGAPRAPRAGPAPRPQCRGPVPLAVLIVVLALVVLLFVPRLYHPRRDRVPLPSFVSSPLCSLGRRGKFGRSTLRVPPWRERESEGSSPPADRPRTAGFVSFSVDELGVRNSSPLFDGPWLLFAASDGRGRVRPAPAPGRSYDSHGLDGCRPSPRRLRRGGGGGRRSVGVCGRGMVRSAVFCRVRTRTTRTYEAFNDESLPSTT